MKPAPSLQSSPQVLIWRAGRTAKNVSSFMGVRTMGIRERLDALFSSADQIPAPFRLAGPVDQRDYLVNGELRRWEGEVQDVFSPVCVKSGAECQRFRIGSFPLMTEREAL